MRLTPGPARLSPARVPGAVGPGRDPRGELSGRAQSVQCGVASVLGRLPPARPTEEPRCRSAAAGTAGDPALKMRPRAAVRARFRQLWGPGASTRAEAPWAKPAAVR